MSWVRRVGALVVSAVLGATSAALGADRCGRPCEQLRVELSGDDTGSTTAAIITHFRA